MQETPLKHPGPYSGIIKPSRAKLRAYLETLHAVYHRPEMIGNDPLSWPRRFSRPADREVAAWIASMVAYGNVRQIDHSLEDLFGRMGDSPAEFVRTFHPGKSDRALKGFYHRFNDDRDFMMLMHLLGQMLRSHGSIEGFWKSAQFQASNSGQSTRTLSERAGNFMNAALALDLSPYYSAGLRGGRSGERSSFHYLMPAAGGPSASKRFHMFMRWVVRQDDGIDLGLWKCESPEDLEYPIDTHIHRIGTYLGATERRSADARTRREITDFFARLAPNDPVRYDFALARLGIQRLCPRQGDLSACRVCELRPACLQHRDLKRKS